MTQNQLFKSKLTQPPLLMIIPLVSDSTTNSCSDYQEELKLLSQEKIGSELLDFPKMEIMVLVTMQEIDYYLSSNTHGTPTVCKYNSLLMILKLLTTIFMIQLKSQMNSINNGTMFTSHTLMQITPPQEESYLPLLKTGSCHHSQESNTITQLT